MRVTVFGSGYVGLVTGACLADAGNDVVCVDVDRDRVEQLNAGKIPIYEPGLDTLVKKSHKAGRLSFTTDAALAVEHGELQFIAVGTPPGEDGSADLQQVLTVARTIGKHLADYRVVVNKSTVPVGTADAVRKEIEAVLAERAKTIEFDVVSNPEFLKEGAAIDDFMKPDRIIVGTDSPRARDLLQMLYEPFNRNHDRMLEMDVRSAELAKYAANAILATKISFMNELANLAERLGADIEEVRIGIGSDPRIGYEFIYPGCGYGGSCFPKDVRALVASAESLEFQPELLRAVQSVNDRQKHVLFEKIRTYFEDDLAGKVIAVWGLSFKPETDDMREASSRVLIDELLARGAHVRAYDPVAGEEAIRIYKTRDDFQLCESANAALQDADVLAIVTEWREFRSPDFSRIKETLRRPAIFDGRNLYDPKTMQRLGLQYFAIGRGETPHGYSS